MGEARVGGQSLIRVSRAAMRGRWAQRGKSEAKLDEEGDRLGS